MPLHVNEFNNQYSFNLLYLHYVKLMVFTKNTQF